MGKANQDDAQTPNPVDPLPDYAVNTLCSILLDVWTAIGWKTHLTTFFDHLAYTYNYKQRKGGKERGGLNA